MTCVSARYARALFDAAREAGGGESMRVEGVIREFLSCLRADPDLRAFLEGPHVSVAKKKAFLSEVFSDPDDGTLLRFFGLLVEKGRFGILSEILEEYRLLGLTAAGVREALVETAFPLDEASLASIRETFRKRVGASAIRETVRVMPELLGGIRVTIGSSVFDGTVQGGLDRMRGAMKK